MRRFTGIAAFAAAAWASVGYAAEPIDAGAVWAPPGDVATSLSGACAAAGPDCLPNLMAQAGASPQAVAFARALEGEGYANGFAEHGTVDLVSAFFPFHANTNWRQFLVNGDPSVVDLNDWERLKTIDLESNADYRTLREVYPNATLWPDGEFNSVEEAEGQRFLILYPVLDGCHACDVLGWANIAYSFDEDGRLTSVELVDIAAP